METGIIGSLWLLKRVPWWVILFVGPLCTTGVIWLLRIIFEGRLYDYSLASFPGDCFIFVYLFCVKQVCERQKLPWNNFFFKKTWHWIIFLSAFVITAGLYGLAKNRFLQGLAIVCLVIYLCLLIYDVAMGNLSQHVQ